VSQCHCIHPTNPTKTSPVHKPGRRSETPAPNRLGHGTDKTKVHASALDYMEVGWSTSHSGSFTPEERDPLPLHGKQNCPQSWFLPLPEMEPRLSIPWPLSPTNPGFCRTLRVTGVYQTPCTSRQKHVHHYLCRISKKDHALWCFVTPSGNTKKK
jgi:hypothetical protein